MKGKIVNVCRLIFAIRANIQRIFFLFGALVAFLMLMCVDFPLESYALKIYFFTYMAFPAVLAFVLGGFVLCMVNVNKNLTNGNGIVAIEEVEIDIDDGLVTTIFKTIYVMAVFFLVGFKGYFLTIGFVFLFKLYARGV